jgi:hypothetical protein
MLSQEGYEEAKQLFLLLRGRVFSSIDEMSKKDLVRTIKCLCGDQGAGEDRYNVRKAAEDLMEMYKASLAMEIYSQSEKGGIDE